MWVIASHLLTWCLRDCWCNIYWRGKLEIEIMYIISLCRNVKASDVGFTENNRTDQSSLVIRSLSSSDHHHHQIICCRIQQIYLQFCKPTSDGIVNSLSLTQSVDWSILFVQLYEQTIQGCTMRFLYLQRTPSAPIQELMFYNAFRKGTHPAMKWTGWVFTEPLIC